MKEYGGYLPLELKNTGEYYMDSENMHVKGVNSGKAAIYCAIKDSNVKKIYIPYYICESVCKIASKTGIEIERYYINKDFMPIDINVLEDEMLLLVNYFGICHERIKSLVEQNDGYTIVDNTQAFFAEPILKDKVYNVYSSKKFIGVADGGYLVSEKEVAIELEDDYSSDKMDFCLQSIEFGTGYAYQSKKENDLRFLEEIKNMSLITKKILSGVDYEFVINRRKENLHVLHKGLAKYNKFNLDDCDFVPYYYPLYLERGIQRELVQEKVYVPVLWSTLLDPQFENTLEQDLSSNIVFIPVDQRYTVEDMEEIVARVNKIIG